MGKHSLAREIYGSLLARVFDLDTPEIAIVDIDPNFYKSQVENVELLKKSTGYNFGSLYLEGIPIFNKVVPQDKLSLAVKIFCFDMLIMNVDRRKEKPNVFQTSKGFIIFDHEQAFPFSRPSTLIGFSHNSWDNIKELWHKNHIFYPSIKNQDCALGIEDFVTCLGVVSDDLLDIIEEQIPEDWHTGNDLGNISSYLANTRDHMELFKRSLQEILA